MPAPRAAPPGSLAEVTLTLDAGAERFPAPFDEQAELEVGRRIERGGGSQYRVNGKEARARDVQTLFADLASGARASAMVSQGRVGALVAARPDERRAILEEAAGIGGLHARRHEAELRLHAADANLQRAEDLRAQLTTQLAGLQKQARQAARFRALSGLVRAAEVDWLGVQNARAAASRAIAHAALLDRNSAVAVAVEAATHCASEAAVATAAVPPLRHADAQARTALERARMACEGIEADIARAATALAAAREALARIGRDQLHASAVRSDAQSAEQRLASEATRLADDLAAEPALREQAAVALALAEAARQTADDALHLATEAAASLAARTHAFAEARSRAEARCRKLEVAIKDLTLERAGLEPTDPAAIETSSQRAAAALAAAADASAVLERADTARSVAEAAHKTARARLHEAAPLHARLAAEAGALAEVLDVHAESGSARMVDLLRVPQGLEAAIGAALGEQLELPADAAAPCHIRTLPPLDPCPPLPDAVRPLAPLVDAPAALHRALSQIGLVEAAAGAALQSALLPGQVLVGAAGEAWRWDGCVQAAGAPTAAATRLRQRNRLAELQIRLGEAEQAHAVARQATEAAEAAERAASDAMAAARVTQRAAEQLADTQRRDLAALQAHAEKAAHRIGALDRELARLRVEQAEASTDAEQARGAAADLASLPFARQNVTQARAALDATRGAEQVARAGVDALQRQASARQGRQRAIMAERAHWAARARDAAERVTDLASRAAEATDAEAALRAEPPLLDALRTAASAALTDAEKVHEAAVTRLAAAEADAAACDRDRRAADAALAASREAALRAEADARDADHAWGTIAERILERLGPDAVVSAEADTTPEAEDRARRKFDRLTRERVEMGPVNLCAESEAAEIETRLAAIDADRDELSAAISKLRGSIGHLNREGRERLTAVFAEVDRHFQHLFARMFGGGQAHLTLVGSDDPLQAGLEIYAQPPGKKLAALSLLSGGEQALTALSLIFAVFRCNPAPVCVLDEVDAPLDDANIDRFCALLADMVRETGTRFLVVTHHHMTMARMDRLYGVTMAERGVSRLLSVDLARATEMVEAVLMAAE